MKILYAVVQWIDGNPVLDGMYYFKSKAKALKEIEEKKVLLDACNLAFEVKYTLIRLFSVQ